jgi:hypothetical protein
MANKNSVQARRYRSLILLVVCVNQFACAATSETAKVDDSARVSDSSESIPIEQFKDAGPVTVMTFSVHLSVTIEPIADRDCDAEHHECYRNCKATIPQWPIKQGSSGHTQYCNAICLARYMDCIGERATRYTFDTMAAAAAWLYKHPQVTLGALIVVGTAVFVVTTEGAGIVLVPYAHQAAQDLAR